MFHFSDFIRLYTPFRVLRFPGIDLTDCRDRLRRWNIFTTTVFPLSPQYFFTTISRFQLLLLLFVNLASIYLSHLVWKKTKKKTAVNTNLFSFLNLLYYTISSAAMLIIYFIGFSPNQTICKFNNKNYRV